jgi:transcriptional regulator with XRE-family HTH domain
MDIGNNIKLLRKRLGKSQEDIATGFGLTRSSYSGYENGVADPGIETLILISDFYKVPLDTLVRKDFAEFSEPEWESIDKGLYADVQGKNIRILTQLVNDNDDDLIEMVPAKARAGYSVGYADPEYLKILPTFSLPFLSKNRKYRSFPIVGDSMPPVVEGSFVVAEFIQNWMTVKSGTPCIMVTKEEGIVFKIVYNQLTENQSFQLCSTNPMYQPYSVHANDILEIWKFVNYISPELPEVRMDDTQLGRSLHELQKEVHELKSMLKDNNK